MNNLLNMDSNKNSFFVAVAGNIGCGKSSLTTVLSQNFRWQAFYEIVETNPYLQDFYSNMKAWSFHTQIFFLTKRFRHLQEILNTSASVIQDRSIYEDAEVFAKSLFLSGLMDERDYRTYAEHFELLVSTVRAPDLMIYLRCSPEVLIERIKDRSRQYEKVISLPYLQRLNEQYEAWIESYQRGPMTVIDVTKMDFVNRPADLQNILSVIKWEIEGIANENQRNLPLGQPRRARPNFSEIGLTPSL